MTFRTDRAGWLGTMLVLALALPACTTTQTLATPTVVGPSVDQDVLAMVRFAVEREPFGAAPDSLFTPTTLFISNGRERRIIPRYAGMGPGGSLRVTGMTGDVRPPHAWALVTYRWEAEDGTASEGKATFLLQQREDGWRIRHVHSSQVLPWQGRE